VLVRSALNVARIDPGIRTRDVITLVHGERSGRRARGERVRERGRAVAGVRRGEAYPFRAAYWVSSAVGLLALLLTVTGVYGVLSYLVTQRTREISIRIALGAERNAILALVMRHSFRLMCAGLAGGVLIALGAAKVFGWRVMMLAAFDPLSYITGIAVVVLARLGASCIPAMRAARIAPMTTLRAD
jgi:predicted lysophospholipase L1 biosynthesis ABC-type transport system permease subunit